jgi:ATP-dependent exoDNAse (exonuclease V) beta subunit
MATIHYLAQKNAHERDSHIEFDEKTHIYTIDGDSDFTSVTTWNHSHFPPFNADAIIKKMMASKKWTESEYFGMTANEIKKKWKNNGKEASEAGTKMHYDIECFYNDMEVEVEENCLEWKYFEDFEESIGSKLNPYRTEWMIWDKDVRLAGSIDMIFENPDGTLQIYDWKRCKEIKQTNKWDSATTSCISHIPDSNFWHYSLQLNTYKWLIEKNYGKKVTNMYLVCLHPNNKNRSFLRYEVPVMTNEINELMDLRVKQCSKKNTKKIRKKSHL